MSTEYIDCPRCGGDGEYHDEVNFPLGQEKLVQCDMCNGQGELRKEIPNERITS